MRNSTQIKKRQLCIDATYYFIFQKYLRAGNSKSFTKKTNQYDTSQIYLINYEIIFSIVRKKCQFTDNLRQIRKRSLHYQIIEAKVCNSLQYILQFDKRDKIYQILRVQIALYLFLMKKCKICHQKLDEQAFYGGHPYCTNCFRKRRNKKCEFPSCRETLSLFQQEKYIFCSTQCSQKAARQQKPVLPVPQNYLPTQMPKLVGRNCSICQKPLEQWQIKKTRTECGYNCFQEALRRKVNPPESIKNRREQIFAPQCSVCPNKLNFYQLRNKKAYCSTQCTMLAELTKTGFIDTSRFQDNRKSQCQKCGKSLQSWQIKKRNKLCSKCYSKQFFFRNHIGRDDNRSTTQQMISHIQKQIVLSSIKSSSGWIQIPNAQILREVLSQALNSSLFGDQEQQQQFQIQKLMIIFGQGGKVIKNYLRDYQQYKNIQAQYDQFDYYYSAYKNYQKKSIKNDLKQVLLQSNITSKFKKNVQYIYIQDIAMILISNSQDEAKRCIKINFTQEYLQVFQQYHQEFANQSRKKRKVPESKKDYFLDHFAVGVTTQNQQYHRNSQVKSYNFFPTLQRKNTCIIIDKQPRRAQIYISLNYQFTIRIFISLNQTSIEYDKQKKDYYFFLKRSPQFQARYNPDSVSYSIRSRAGHWLTIDNLILEHGNLAFFNEFEKLRFSKEITLYLHVQNDSEMYKWSLAMKQMSIKTKFLPIIQLFQDGYYRRQNYVEKIRLMKQFLSKESTKSHQQKIKYWSQLHYIQLDILLAIQLNNLQNIKNLFDQSKELKEKSCSLEVIQQLFQLIHTEKIYLSSTKRKQEKLRAQKKEKKKQKEKIIKIVAIFNVAFTPTGIKYRGYTNQFESRILRQFPNDLFIKGTFCNEDGTKIISKKKDEDSTYYIQNQFKSYLNGFILQGVQYFPLGWSNSQIKNTQLWFINSDSKFYKEGRSIRQEIYNFLGDFSSISNPAKKASRIGQSFSSSARFLQAENINKPLQIPDIKTEIYKKDNAYIQYVFSDGIGMISQNLLESIRKQLKLNGDVCAIQCRYLGIKGVLALGIKSKESLNNVYVSKSMIKYECLWNEQTKKHFDVLNWNKYCPGFINVEIILLLLGLGVELKVLIRKVKQILQEELYNHNINNQTIINYYKTHLDHSPSNQDSLYQLIDFLHNCEEYKHLKNLLKSEKFFCQIIDKVKRQISIKAYKKIRVRVKKAARLMGILDTYGVLKQGEVYCTILKKKNQYLDNIAQNAFMTKNPCLHPADIRKVKCVSDDEISQRLIAAGFDEKQFKKYVNVIVFNKEGEYPLPAQISGGDLDGDYYFICWDEDLQPQQFQPPHLYDSGIIEDKELIKQIEQGRQSEQQQKEGKIKDKAIQQIPSNGKKESSQNLQNSSVDVIGTIKTLQIVDFRPQNEVMNESLLNFFTFYMEKNMLGLVTRYHTLYAQSKQYGGVKGFKCLQIAKLHAKQLDFGKKGKADERFPPQLQPPKEWKLYKEKHWSQRRQTPLGQIFNQIVNMHYQNKKRQKQKQVKQLTLDNWSVRYQKFEFSPEEIQQALETLRNYKRDVEIILFNHNKINSSEFIIYHGRDEDYITDSIMLRQQYRNIFFDDEDDKELYQAVSIGQFLNGTVKFKEDVYKKAYLWYLVSMAPFFYKQSQRYKPPFKKEYNTIIQKSTNLVQQYSKDFRGSMKTACYFQFKEEDDEDDDDQSETQIQSGNSPYQHKGQSKFRKGPQDKMFQNVYGLTWHVIPKLIISIVNQAEMLK